MGTATERGGKPERLRGFPPPRREGKPDTRVGIRLRTKGTSCCRLRQLRITRSHLVPVPRAACLEVFGTSKAHPSEFSTLGGDLPSRAKPRSSEEPEGETPDALQPKGRGKARAGVAEPGKVSETRGPRKSAVLRVNGVPRSNPELRSAETDFSPRRQGRNEAPASFPEHTFLGKLKLALQNRPLRYFFSLNTTGSATQTFTGLPFCRAGFQRTARTAF